MKCDISDKLLKIWQERIDKIIVDRVKQALSHPLSRNPAIVTTCDYEHTVFDAHSIISLKDLV